MGVCFYGWHVLLIGVFWHLQRISLREKMGSLDDFEGWPQCP